MSMNIKSFAFDMKTNRWSVPTLPGGDSERTLVLAFGAPEMLDQPAALDELRKAYPKSHVVGCSSAGEIHGTQIRDQSLSVSVAQFDKTQLRTEVLEVATAADSFSTGQTLAQRLNRPDLRGVLILSEGLNVNGSELVRGINEVLDESVVVTGGLSGDGTRFKRTWVAANGRLKSGLVAAVGFYGDHVQIGHGSKGGWDKFGPERVVTRAEGNVLYELDGKPALALYKEYLGEKAAGLPATGLLFPLSLRATAKDEKFLVRTLLAVDAQKQSMTFAGDVPKGYLAQLMKADFERLIGGASLASAMAKETGTPVGSESLVVAISCVGRRLVLGERTEEEVEAVLDALPKAQNPHITGFYSYGELSPYAAGHCDLHNQTMTLTVFSESPTPLPRKAHKGATPSVQARPAVPAARPAASAPTAKRPDDPFGDLDMETAISTLKPSTPGTAGFKVKSFAYDLKTKRWSVPSLPGGDSERTLVLAFGAPEMLDQPAALDELRKAYPKSHVVGCSSAGEIHGTQIRDQSLSVSVAKFDKTQLRTEVLDVASAADSFSAGQTLAQRLNRPDLRGVLILSEGLNVNGSELVRGINEVLDESVVVTGGLSGDGTRFKRTWVAANGRVKSGMVAAVGFYGDHVQIGHGSKGGWDKFGPERVVTRSEGNVLYELDGKPALALYKEYLGEKAAGLPATGLLFPLSLRATSTDEKFLVRTLLAVDAQKQSMTFAGDVPKGYLAQLMKADFERLIGGASLASAMAKETGTPVGSESLVVAISCVGRRLVLGERTEEEVEAVLEALPKGQSPHITGFYSYGELSPYAAGHCDLHNQTMTLTVFSESPTALPRKAHKGAAQSAQARPAAPVAAPQITTSPSKEPNTVRPPATAAAVPPPPTSTRVPSARPAAPSAVVTRSGATQGATTGVNVTRKQYGDVTVVSFAGRLTESFKGETLGRSLNGTVVFDLADVDRVTSFGVREWLQMMAAAEHVKHLYFARCSEAIVNQLGMIRKFAGSANVVSFFTPYLCDSCGEQFERLLDCERDGDALREGQPPLTTCTRCQGQGRFDDDPRTYFAFASAWFGAPVPTEVRTVVDELSAIAQTNAADAVDKAVEGQVTTIRINTKLTSALRWPRLLDGIEGQLVIDFTGVSGAEPAGIANFDSAVRGLPREVSSVVLERAPQALLDRFASSGLPQRVTVGSAMLDGHCESCSVHRAALVVASAHADVLNRGGTPNVPCKRCNGPLALNDAKPALGVLASSLARTTPSIRPPEAPRPAPTNDVMTGAPSLGGFSLPREEPLRSAAPPSFAPQVPPPRVSPTFTASIVGIAVAGIAFMAWSGGWGGPRGQAAVSNAVAAPPPPAPTAPAAPVAAPTAPTTAWAAASELPPAWAERPFVIEQGSVFVVGRSGPGANAEAVATQARNEAISRIVHQMYGDLQGSPMHEFVQARIHDDAAKAPGVTTRFLAQVGATATPERVELVTRTHDGAIDGIGRYRLSKAAYDEALASYRETASFQGMTVARIFPLLEASLHTDGDLIVVSVQHGRPAEALGVRPGDVVLSVGSRRVGAVDAFAKASNDEWAGTAVRATMPIELESTGARRTVRFFKPVPPNP